MGERFCEPLRSRVPAFLDFSFAFRIPTFLYDIFFVLPCALAFLFRVPMLLCPLAYVWGWGATHHTRAECVWADQVGRVNSPPRHYPPSSRVRSVRVYWLEAGLGSNS